MAIFYIDPSSAVDGDGSQGNPFNTIVGKTLSAGNIYLFKKGTTYTPGSGTVGISCTQSYVTVSSYGDGERPIINGVGLNRGVQISNDITNIVISGLRITGVDTGTSMRGITNSTTGSSGTIATNITIEDCEIDSIGTDAANDCNAVQLWGKGNQIKDNHIHDVATDGIWALGQNLLIRGNTVTDVSQDGRGQGDCIQIGGASDDFEVSHNTLDHTGLTAKQAVIVDNAGGTGGLVAYNTITESNNANCVAIYSGQANMTVRGNRVTGGVVCINSTRANIRIEGNLCINTFSRGIDVGTGGITCVNNTVVGGQQGGGIGIRYLTAGTTATIKNNIVESFPTGLSLAASAYDEDYNDIYDCATKSNRTLGTHTLIIDPQLDSRYVPTSRQILVSGTDVGGGYDLYGNQFANPPAIGAVQTYYDVSLLNPQIIANSGYADERDIRKAIRK